MKQKLLDQLIPRGIDDPRILSAMERVPREEFVPEHLREFAYEDGPLPIACGQTISQPYVVAVMTQLAQLIPSDRVLEVGTGSGYQAAVLAELVAEVYTIERFDELTTSAAATLKRLGYDTVSVRVGDGSLGWPEHAPYNAILVTAAAPSAPASLTDQLAIGGRLVIPVGPEAMQSLMRITKTPSGELKEEMFEPVRFVPLVGKEGF